MLLLAVALGLIARGAAAQDYQYVAPGNGLAGTLCVDAGVNGSLQSTRTGDDTLFPSPPTPPTQVRSGPNGLCDTTAAGDDVQVIPVGNGFPNAAIILADDPSLPTNGICDDAITALGDDVVRVSAGSSEPGMLAIHPGGNAAINTTAAGDDVVTAVICPGGDGTIETSPNPADVNSVVSPLCTPLCTGSIACIIPGPDGTLQSVVSPTDVLVPFVSSGADGIAQTTSAGDDAQVITVGQGFQGTVCVSAGPDGIAQTTLCGNGVTDLEENTIIGDTECDDGNTSSNDGCNATCNPEFCGDTVVQPGIGESCEDGNTRTDDDCAQCHLAVCGDTFIHTRGTGPFEECEPPSTPTCDATCHEVVPPGCGDGITQPGEQCDDANNRKDDDCVFCQLAVCGDTFVHTKGTPPFEQCEPPSTPTCDATCQVIVPPGCGNGTTDPGEQCDDANSHNDDDCVIGCQLAVCGDGFVHTTGTGPFEECEPPNTTTCDATCHALPFCGDGIVQTGLGEECDDGNTRNNDDCVLGCHTAICGDGYLHRNVEECEPPNTPTCSATCEEITPPRCGDHVLDPGEQCDDGNTSNKDDCLNDCTNFRCGDGALHTKGTPPYEECDDGNSAPGDGCSAGCTTECGNGVIDGGCSEGRVGESCDSDDDCDTSPGAGNGACVAEACDPGAASLCAPGPGACSNVCQFTLCGNGEVECLEQCDLGADNGVPGSGCTATCSRNLVGKEELTRSKECPSAFTLDSAPQDLRHKLQTCTDGAACDFDSIPGQCTFHVGVCLNRPSVPGCVRGGLQAFDVRGFDVDNDPLQAADAEALTTAIASLTPDALVPDRCRKGLRGKDCSIPEDHECDSHFGAGDGVCNIGTGVLFLPPLDPADLGGTQTSACTPGVDVAVAAGAKISLRATTRRTTGPVDKDTLRLVCRP